MISIQRRRHINQDLKFQQGNKNEKVYNLADDSNDIWFLYKFDSCR
jgi:hypothetical protein